MIANTTCRVSAGETEDDAYLTCDGMNSLDMALRGTQGSYQPQKLADLATLPSEASGYSRVCCVQMGQLY